MCANLVVFAYSPVEELCTSRVIWVIRTDVDTGLHFAFSACPAPIAQTALSDMREEIPDIVWKPSRGMKKKIGMPKPEETHSNLIASRSDAESDKRRWLIR